MGEFAATVQAYLRDELSAASPDASWTIEHRIAGTPVDVAGETETQLRIVELEWRRADPADNTAKLFRHLDSGDIDASQVLVFQVFTNYYNLVRGGVSSKRKNADFVGTAASEATPRLSYYPLEFDLDPPKRGGDWPADWQTAAETVVAEILTILSAD